MTQEVLMFFEGRKHYQSWFQLQNTKLNWYWHCSKYICNWVGCVFYQWSHLVFLVFRQNNHVLTACRHNTATHLEEVCNKTRKQPQTRDHTQKMQTYQDTHMTYFATYGGYSSLRLYCLQAQLAGKSTWKTWANIHCF